MSRIARAASQVSGINEREAKSLLVNARIAVSLENDSEDARTTFLAAVRLALLFAGAVTIVVPTENNGLWDQCRNLAVALRGSARRIRRSESLNGLKFAAALSVGQSLSGDPRVVSVSSSGWLIRVLAASSEGGRPSIENLTCDDVVVGNVIAALGAAAVGMGEVFLRMLNVPRDALAFEWSLFDYAMGSIGSLAKGPTLDRQLPIRGLQVGAGTVGGGFDLALSLLDARGLLWIVDPQFARRENFGPHPLIGTGDYGKPKVLVAKAALDARHSGRLDVVTFREPISFTRLRLGTDIEQPAVIISGLDKARPRHQVQRWWAPLHIDMATGGFQCQAIVRLNPGTGRCLIEAFHPGEEPAEEDVWSEQTGLRSDRLANPMAEITDADVNNAPPAQRSLLRRAQERGQRMCSVVTGAEAGAKDDRNFAAAAPFIALLAGVLAVAELVKSRTAHRDGVFVQYNFLRNAVFYEITSATNTCECRAA
jgi:molybdopterin/thiamine biosynthesis adenylyltransferase